MDLMRYIPWETYHDEEHVADFQRAWGKELDVLIGARDDYYQQMRVGTATWGLALFEKEYGITPDPDKAIEQRRANWRAKRRGRGTTTTAVLKETTELVTGLPAEVIEYPELDYFEIQIDGRDKPFNIKDLITIIEEIKPAHLGMVFVWRSTTETTVHASVLSHTRQARECGVGFPKQGEERVCIYTAQLSHDYACHREGYSYE